MALSLIDQVFHIPEHNPETFSMIGAEEGKLLVIVDEGAFGTDEETMLNNMITAIKFDPKSDISKLILKRGQPIILSYFHRDFKNILVFGITPDQLGLNIEFKLYDILHFEKYRMLVCDSITEIRTVVQKKQMLWARLQEMFLK